MCSIAEDQSLPVDFNGTSLQLSSPMDSTIQDPLASSLSSEVETPGMFPNLTSVGGISPHRVRTVKDQEQQLAELRKDNFGLKLRIYHLEEALTKKWGDRSEGWQLNIELQIQMDNLKKELAEKDALIVQAKGAINAMAANHAQELKELRQAAASAGDLQALEERLEDKEAELEDALRQSEEANARANEMQQLSEQLEGDMREKDREMEEMQRELDDMRREMAEQREAAKAVPAKPRTHNANVQTSEPVVDRAEVEGLQAQLADTAARLQESERAILELRGEVSDRAGRVKELEVELLTASQRLAAGASDHAQQMMEQAARLDKCKADLRNAEAELRRQGAELGERERECGLQQREAEDACRRAREAEERAGDLEPRTRAAEREAMDLRRQLREAQAQAEEEAMSRDRDIRDLEGRLREAEERLGRSRPEMATRQRELEEMARTLRERENEISQLKSQLLEKDGDVSRARRATHAANMERQEQARALGELRGELDGLRDQLHQQQANVQQDTAAAMAAKDAIIGQLKRELQDLHAKLAEADDRLLHLTTSKAAELGVLQGTVEDLSQQVEQLEGQLRALRKEAGQLTGEKAALQREVNKLRAENQGLQEQLATLESQLAGKSRQLQAAERTIADLQRLVEELQRAQPSRDLLEREAAEKAQLRSQLAALRKALGNKEEETGRLGQTLSLKDETIRDLQEQLERAEEEREREAERARELQREKSELQGEVAGLQSQGRIAQLSSDDLQARLTDVYREREELARRLREAEEALGDKDTAYERARKACEALQRQVAQLQEQVMELSRRGHSISVGVGTSSPGRQDSGVMAGGVDESVGTSPPTAQQGGAGNSSTTMIFGSLSEDLLKTILQRLQEIYAEILTNRASGTEASSTLASKMEHLTDLQRHLESCFHESQSHAGDSKPASGNTSYTAYYFMRGEDGEPLVVDGDDEEDGEKTPPRKSSTPKKTSPKTPPKLFKEHFSGEGPLRDAQTQIGALQSELEEVKRWNDALQTRLKESGGTRDVGVGMEKGGEAAPSQSATFAPEKYLELEAEVDRLLGELEGERERSQAEREQQESECAALRGELSAAEERVAELEQRLREAMMRDAATSTGDEEGETVESSLREEAEGLRQEVGEAEATIAGLRGRLQVERDDNQRLRSELSELRQERLRRSPATAEKATSATASMPNLLLTPDRTPGKRTADSWTSPGVVPTGSQGEGLDMRALKERHEEVTRLNQELQRKCREQLHKSPPSAATSSSTSGTATQSSTYWQGKLRDQEQTLRSEMLERERSLLAQLRQSEARCAEREAEGREREAGLQRQAAELEARLGQCGQDCEGLRAKLSEALAACREKDEERINLTRSLSQSSARVRDLEHELEQLLASKSASVRLLEEQQRERERELHEARERAEELAQTVESLERSRAEEEEEEEGELETLRESVESLSQQLASALEELEASHRQNAGLEEHRSLLHSQLSSCREQVATLQAELQLYQKLLQDSTKSPGGLGGSAGVGLTSERVVQLLEEVRRLREQLNQGVRNSSALAEQLRSKLGTQGSPLQSASSTGSHEHGEGAVPQRSEGTQTTPTCTQPPSHVRTQMASSLTRRPGEPQAGTSPAGHGYTASLPRSQHSAAPYAAKLSLGSIGTLTVKADVLMSDASSSSLPQLTPSARPPRADASLLLSAPRSHSSPFVRGMGPGGSGQQRVSHTSLTSERGRGGEEMATKLFSSGVAGIHKSTHIAGSKGSLEHSRQQQQQQQQQQPLDDYLSREGIPKLEPTMGSLHSLHSRQSSTSSSASVSGAGGGNRGSRTAATVTTNRRTASSTTQTASSATAARNPPQPPPGFTLPRGVGGEFESLESRLKQALESSSLQGADRSFLEELLLYLRQQRRQLDESWRLLENMEQQQQQRQEVGGASQVTVETAQSGTIPSSAGTRREGGGMGGARVGSSGVDLSSLYDHLLRTQASLMEAKSNLHSHQKNT